MTATAREIAVRTATEFARMAEAWEDATDADGDTSRRLATLLRTGTAWPTGPRSVAATVTGTDAALWGYTAGQVLDAAADLDEVFTTGQITETAPGSWHLTW